MKTYLRDEKPGLLERIWLVRTLHGAYEIATESKTFLIGYPNTQWRRILAQTEHMPWRPQRGGSVQRYCKRPTTIMVLYILAGERSYRRQW